MFRLFIIFNFFVLALLACEGGYDSCKQKVIDSNTIQEKSIEIPIEGNQRLIFSEKTPSCEIIKSDSFLGLYLVEDLVGFEYPFKINVGISSGIAAINKTSALEGKIIKKQIGLSSLAQFDKKISSPAIITNSCCSLEGIVTPKGIIEKEYIERFLSAEDTIYADMGMSVSDAKAGVIVDALSPFVKNNPFKGGDIILSLDGNKVKESATLMREILFSEIGSKHTVQIKRDSKIVTIDVVAQKREIGAFKKFANPEEKAKVEKSEKYGFEFDKNLKIIKISEKSKKYGLKTGDKLLQINGVAIKNQQELLKKVSDSKDGTTLLFERENFQFFVNIN
ncbi:MAG: PDZ domain-containing protein [Campylobacterales bacterium]|nr:PDZ domain-containing protein [Campylobacterales bacterium]